MMGSEPRVARSMGGSGSMETAIGIALVVIAAIEILGIVRVVSNNLGIR